MIRQDERLDADAPAHDERADEERRPPPGKVTRTSRLPPSARAVARELRALSGPAVQRLAATDPAELEAASDPASVQRLAQQGVGGAGSALPHLGAIQAAFGRHDVSGVRAHVGGAAARAAREIGALAYATGDDIAFAGVPDLRQAAHEAAHVVQQRGGVDIAGGVGSAGDRYEQHADAVADAVVRGESVQALLDPFAGLLAGGSAGVAAGAAIQRDPTAALRRLGALIAANPRPPRAQLVDLVCSQTPEDREAVLREIAHRLGGGTAADVRAALPRESAFESAPAEITHADDDPERLPGAALADLYALYAMRGRGIGDRATGFHRMPNGATFSYAWVRGAAGTAILRGEIRSRLLRGMPGLDAAREAAAIDATRGAPDRVTELHAMVDQAAQRSAAGDPASAPALLDVGDQGRTYSPRGRRREDGADMTGRIHAAMDAPSPTGTGVYAPIAGTVVSSGMIRGYGNLVTIVHDRMPAPYEGRRFQTAYAHLSQRLVEVGVHVAAGQAIGLVGNTRSDAHGDHGVVASGMAPHLHFGLIELVDGAPPQTWSSRGEEAYARRRDPVRPDTWLRALHTGIGDAPYTSDGGGAPVQRQAAPRPAAVRRVVQRTPEEARRRYEALLAAHPEPTPEQLTRLLEPMSTADRAAVLPQIEGRFGHSLAERVRTALAGRGPAFAIDAAEITRADDDVGRLAGAELRDIFAVYAMRGHTLASGPTGFHRAPNGATFSYAWVTSPAGTAALRNLIRRQLRALDTARLPGLRVDLDQLDGAPPRIAELRELIDTTTAPAAGGEDPAARLPPGVTDDQVAAAVEHDTGLHLRIDWVRRLQSRLRADGRMTSVDGVFDTSTVIGLMWFQRDAGLTVNGEVTAETRRAIEAGFRDLHADLVGPHLDAAVLVPAEASGEARYGYYRRIITGAGGVFLDGPREINLLGIRGVHISGEPGQLQIERTDSAAQFAAARAAAGDPLPGVDLPESTASDRRHFSGRTARDGGFDDAIISLWYEDGDGGRVYHVTEHRGSVDPEGQWSEDHPTEGTSHLRDGQYRYGLGHHTTHAHVAAAATMADDPAVHVTQGVDADGDPTATYTALEPQDSLEVWRDGPHSDDRFLTSDEQEASDAAIARRDGHATSAGVAINIHTAGAHPSSVGCQNIPVSDGYQDLIHEVAASANPHRVYYSLIDASRIDGPLQIEESRAMPPAPAAARAPAATD